MILRFLWNFPKGHRCLWGSCCFISWYWSMRHLKIWPEYLGCIFTHFGLWQRICLFDWIFGFGSIFICTFLSNTLLLPAYYPKTQTCTVTLWLLALFPMLRMVKKQQLMLDSYDLNFLFKSKHFFLTRVKYSQIKWSRHEYN